VDAESFVLAGSSTAYFSRSASVRRLFENADRECPAHQQTNPWGHVVYRATRHDGNADLLAHSRHFARRRNGGHRGAIVHERDFRGQLRFMSVPVDARFRTTLRLWALD